MVKFCTSCGTELKDGMAFCTNCGAKACEPQPVQPQPVQQPIPQPQPVQPQPVQQPVPQPQPVQQPIPQPIQQPVPQPQPVQPQPVQQPIFAQGELKPDNKGKYGIVSTGAFFGLIFLFAIPIVGFVACLIFAFASKNENRKHFARAFLIWMLIALVLGIIFSILSIWLGKMLFDYVGAGIESLTGDFGSTFEAFDIMEQFENSGLNGLQ